MEGGIRLSAIVVNHNTREYLRRCLLSVRVALGADDEIWVVDNASEDGSAEMVEREFPWVRLLISKRNVGYGVANNVALRRARGKYLVLLNSDVFLNRGSIEELARFMENTPEAGVAGGRLLNPDGSVQPSCRPFPTYRNLIMSRRSLIRRLPLVRHSRRSERALSEVREVEVVAGAFMIIRREALLKVGAFDPRFFLYVEDTDLCFRMRESGWKVFFVPWIDAFHVWGGTTQRVQTFALVNHHKSMWRFFEKHHPERITRNYALLIALFFQLALHVALVTVRSGRREVGR